MSGTSIQITTGTAAVRDAVAALVAAGHDLREPFEEIGASLLTSTQQRFQDEESPAGEPWVELTRRTQRRRFRSGRRRGAENKLRVKGLLYASLTYLASSEQVQLGTNLIYGAIHQLGGTDDMPPGPAAVPARPYLGLSADDEREIGAILTDHLTEAWG